MKFGIKQSIHLPKGEPLLSGEHPPLESQVKSLRETLDKQEASRQNLVKRIDELEATLEHAKDSRLLWKKRFIELRTMCILDGVKGVENISTDEVKE